MNQGLGRITIICLFLCIMFHLKTKNMKLSKPYLAQILFFLTIGFTGNAQNHSIEITSEMKDDRSVDFLFQKKDVGSFYLNLTFNRLENASPAAFKGTITSSQGKLMTIKPLNPDRSVGYSYKYTYIRGQLNPKIDTGFVYLLPVSKGKMVKALNHFNLNAMYFGSVEPKNWKSFQFDLEPGDTVFAARKGVVVEVKDGIDPNPSASVSYSSDSNSILIEHEDGTLAHYSVLKKASLMVEPGQVVFPHTALGLAGTYDLESNTQVRFYVYYLVEKNIERTDQTTLQKMKNFYAFLNPRFATTEGETYLKAQQNYSADFKEEHIIKELNKREKKRLAAPK